MSWRCPLGAHHRTLTRATMQQATVTRSARWPGVDPIREAKRAHHGPLKTLLAAPSAAAAPPPQMNEQPQPTKGTLEAFTPIKCWLAQTREKLPTHYNSPSGSANRTDLTISGRAANVGGYSRSWKSLARFKLCRWALLQCLLATFLFPVLLKRYKPERLYSGTPALFSLPAKTC